MKDNNHDRKDHPGRGCETMFRVTMRNQVALIRIADTKASMILGINSMIITVLIGILGSKMIFSEITFSGNLNLAIPIVIIMITAMVSAVYAIQATRPRLLNPEKPQDQSEEKKKSLLFFENIAKLEQTEYVEVMKDVINSGMDVYENMIIDVYNQSIVLHQKFRLLRISYFSFLIGFILSGSSFILFWLIP